MRYEQVGSDHFMVLTVEETDDLFDPFDPLDGRLPSYLHHAGHRYIRQKPYDWLVSSVGEANEAWYHYYVGLNRRGFLFREASGAALFKLTFHRGE